MILQPQKMLFEQIADYFGSLIAKGAFAPGAALPSVREVALQESVNPNTVVKAYGLLEERGLIISVPKKGYFVKESASEPDDLAQALSYLLKKGYTAEQIKAAVSKLEEEAHD